MRVWKFTVEPDRSVIRMPQGAQVISVAAQGDHVCLWALVDPDAPVEDREFIPVMTGEAIDEGARYVGSAHGVSGWIVVHVFEDPR